MPFPQDYVSTGAAADLKKDGSEDTSYDPSAVSTSQIITSLGHEKAVLQTVQGGAGSATVTLEGSNDRTNWNILATNTHTGSDTQFAEVTDKAYKYWRVNMSAHSGADVDYFLRLAGASGTY